MKPYMKAVAKYLILELDPRKNISFFRKKDIKETTLDDFKVASHEIDKINMFERMWMESLRKKVKKLIIKKHGRFSTTT